MRSFTFNRVVSRKFSLRGVFPPIPTPFLKSSELVDFNASEANFEKLKRKNLSGYVALGSNGQYPFLSETESLEFVTKSVNLAHSHGRCLIAGAGRESTIETVRRCEAYANAGVDAVLVIPPHYYSPLLCDLDYVDHFYRVADESKVPVILYNMPRFAHVNLSIDCVKKLAVHDNIIGIKDSTGNIERYGEIVKATSGQKFSLISGTGSQFCSALEYGAVGCIAALANVLGDELSYIFKKFEEGKLSEAKKMQDELQAANESVTTRFGLRGLNHALKLFGYEPGVLRSPLKPVKPEEAKIIQDIFQKFLK